MGGVQVRWRRSVCVQRVVQQSGMRLGERWHRDDRGGEEYGGQCAAGEDHEQRHRDEENSEVVTLESL